MKTRRPSKSTAASTTSASADLAPQPTLAPKEGNAFAAAAVSGVADAGESFPYLDAIQASFGHHDISGTRAHFGDGATEAADDLGAQAYAYGSDVAFADSPSLWLAAHEAAHTVQQRGAGAMGDEPSQRGDALERHADAVADKVVRGESSEALLDEQASPEASDAAPKGIQRFNTIEHAHLGNMAVTDGQAGPKMIELAPGYEVEFGDLTAMAGDFFASAAQIRSLAQVACGGANSREELEIVRWKEIRKKSGPHPVYGNFSDEAKRSQKKRYYKLAGSNFDPLQQAEGAFDRGPGSTSNRDSYLANHERAVWDTALSASAGIKPDLGWLHEGFASHYLTDAFSAGHVKTERRNLRDYWDPKVPMFWTNFKFYVAEKMSRELANVLQGKVAGEGYPGLSVLVGLGLTDQKLFEKVLAGIEKKGLPALTFGDLISGASHDFDGEKGVETQHGMLYGDGSIMNSKGQEHLKGIDTADAAIRAVQISARDVQTASVIGASMHPDAVVRDIKGEGGGWPAEAMWPKPVEEVDQLEPRETPDWFAESPQDLFDGALTAEGIRIFGKEKASDIEGALSFEDERLMGFTIFTGDEQKEAFKRALVNPLSTDAVAVARSLIEYTPVDRWTAEHVRRHQRPRLRQRRQEDPGRARVVVDEPTGQARQRAPLDRLHARRGGRDHHPLPDHERGRTRGDLHGPRRQPRRRRRYARCPHPLRRLGPPACAARRVRQAAQVHAVGSRRAREDRPTADPRPRRTLELLRPLVRRRRYCSRSRSSNWKSMSSSPTSSRGWASRSPRSPRPRAGSGRTSSCTSRG